MEKKFIRAKVEDFDAEMYLANGASLDDAIYNLGVCKEKYTKLGWRNLALEHFVDYDYQEYELWGERLETDEEFEERVKAEKKRAAEQKKKKEKTEAQERKLYKKLKKKFEK